MDAIHALAGIAATLLIIELLVAVAVVGVVAYFARRGLVVGRQRLIPWLGTAQEYTRRAETVTSQASQAIVRTQVGIISTVRGVRQAVETFLQQ